MTHVTTFIPSVTRYTPSHFWYTVLVCIDLNDGPVAGGDFSFAGLGWVLKLEHGDVIIYNPQIYHGTTEFRMANPTDSRVMFAFFCSGGTLDAAIKSRVVSERRGVLVFNPITISSLSSISFT